MVFSTHLFIFYFLPLVLLLAYSVRFRYLSGTLALFSYAFYGWSNPPWALIMFASTMVDYVCGWVFIRLCGLKRGPDGVWPVIDPKVPRTGGMKITLALSMLSNLTLLGFFKYFDFTVENLNRVAGALGLGPDAVPLLHVALPVGISFYTFQSMSYAIDVYRGNARPTTNFMDFHCFEALFPQLVAGPIIRYQTVAEQIRRRVFSYEKFARGVAFFSLGMAKKILLANPMGHVADGLFAAGSLHWYDAWYGVTAYAFQIYFDFSAYSDMAVGLGLMIGFLFMKNFDDPYHADSITDFWRRWHISLSTWLRDYLYIPLGGNRRGHARTYINLMLVMLIGGLWHGAAWNFMIWGGIHGLMLAAERMQGKDSAYRHLPRPLRVAVTFVIVCLSWVFFRAETLPQAWSYFRSLFGVAAVPYSVDAVAATVYTPYHLAIFVGCIWFVWKAPQAWEFSQRLTPARAGVCYGLLLVSVVFMWTQSVNPFLYFQF
jgi:alginate O-acetyltransferase complex protein AlgI